MKKIAALLAACLFLSGCTAAQQPNNQSYAISLSVDESENGQLEIAAQIPTIGAGASSGTEENVSQSGYIMIGATGATFSEALDLMQATAQRRLNLSQLKTVVFSQSVAGSEDFFELLTEMVMTYQLYGAANLIVCPHAAKDFISSQQAVIGVRLSTSVTAELEHYHGHGYTPQSTIADVFYHMCSVYSDPVGILAATADGKTFRAIPEDRMGDAYAGALPRTGASANEYFGSALFSGERMAGVLSGLETQMRNLLAGELTAFACSVDGKALKLTLESAPDVEINLDGDAPEIDVWIKINMLGVVSTPEPEAVANYLAGELDAVTEKCQLLSAEPFGFAEVAAAQFLTLEDWQNYNWRARFPQSTVRYHILVR